MISDDRMDILSKKIGYTFKNRKLLVTALTHSSYVNENRLRYYDNNERLEFLGDAILDAVISEYLYFRYEKVEEGILTKRRASIVCEQALSMAAQKLDLGSYLILGKGEENNGGRTRPSMMADAVEAVIGAVFIDSGWDNARTVAINMLKDVIEEAESGLLNRDFKSLIQERYQARGESSIVYRVTREEGPDHNKTFFIDLEINGKVMGSGEGKSKKEAEQKAARAVYESGDKQIVF